MLPFHRACGFANFNTAKYLFTLYPESISIPGGRSGEAPLHMALWAVVKCGRPNGVELITFLLDNDQGALSTPSGVGRLPLHSARNNADVIIKSISNAYPEAIHTTDNNGETPLVSARNRNMVEMVDFFERQIELEEQARIDRTPDNNGQLPIHRALHNGNASLGGIKLMLAANQASITLADNQGYIPLHIACHTGNLDAAKFLIGVDEGTLQATDTRGNLPLHLACAGGNCKVVSCILDYSTYGVTLQNSNKQTPIELLLYEPECDRDSMDYVEAIRCLFLVNPDDTLKCLMKKDSSYTTDDKQGEGNKRKRV